MSERAGDKADIYTRAVHLPAPPVPEQQPLGLATYRTSTFGFDTAEHYSDVLGDRAPGYVYSRIDNPTADAFATAVAALEGCEAAQPFASGMAAISTTLLTFLSAGDHVVADRALYGGTFALLQQVLPRFGVTATLVDGADPDAVEAAFRPETRVAWFETIANPTLAVADLPALAAAAHRHGALLCVDSTFASPAVCRPAEWGADLVVHSATKFLGGHSDATGGVVAGPADLVAQVRLLRSELGGSLAPDEAFLLRRGLATLPLRVDRQCATALAFARAFEDDPRVESVRYPGLPSHPGHEVAGRLFDRRDGEVRYGAIVTIAPAGGRAAGTAVCNRLRLAHNATSLGGTVSKVSHVASTTHRQLDDAALAAAGITPAAIRVSIGLEDPADLIADFDQALTAG